MTKPANSENAHLVSFLHKQPDEVWAVVLTRNDFETELGRPFKSTEEWRRFLSTYEKAFDGHFETLWDIANDIMEESDW